MLVYLHRNYDYPNLFRQTPDNTGKWGDIQFTFDTVDQCDYIIVLNHPKKDINIRCRKGGRILIIQEPPYERNQYLTSYFKFFDKIICDFDKVISSSIVHSQAALPWHIEKNYDELSELTIDRVGKQDKVSWITSNINIYPEHKIRLNFIDYLKKESYDFDLYGRGFEFIDDKFNGIHPYKYTIAAENYIGKDYFTEKIIDAYLSWSMPIYSGCLNITDYFPAESMVKIDLNNHKEALERIKETVANKLWDKNKEAIRHARDLVLNKYQLFPMLQEFLNSDKIMNTKSGKYESVFIPRSGLTRTEELKKNIKKIFNRK